MWKWEQITIDFITNLLNNAMGFDTIWVIVDSLTKSAHILCIRESCFAEKLAEIYVQEVVARNDVPNSIILDWDFFSLPNSSKF